MKAIISIIYLAIWTKSSCYTMGMFSSCLKSTVWTRSSGSELKSWLSSIIPSDSDSSKFEVEVLFSRNRNFDKILKIYSKYSRVKWEKIGPNKLDGWMYGVTDEDKNYRDKYTYFIFPDFKTALVGTFKNNKLLSGVETKVSHLRCANGLMELKFTKQAQNSPIFKYIERSKNVLSHDHLLRDPLEKRNVYIGSSVLIPEISHEDALFARRNISAYSLISYYGGNWEDYSTPYFESNMTIDQREDRHKNLITFNKTHGIDVPFSMADIRFYRSTLGHKANHMFLEANSVYEFTMHPVYGNIRCLESTRIIQQGEEIIVNYNYNMNGKHVPRWYKSLYKKVKEAQTISETEE